MAEYIKRELAASCIALETDMSLMTAIHYTRKSIAARMEEEKADAEAPDCLTPLKDVLIGRLAVEQELLDLLERWKR